MRENRPYGSEGGEAQITEPFRPLSLAIITTEREGYFGFEEVVS